MSRAKPTLMFIDAGTWEAFSALAGAMRVRGVRIERVTVASGGVRAQFLRWLDRVLYGKTRYLVRPAAHSAGLAQIDEDHLATLLPAGVVDVQATDDLSSQLAGLGEPILHGHSHVGIGVDAAILTDKLLLSDFCSRIGVPTPRQWESHDGRNHPVDDHGYPIVVKTPIGSAGTGVRIVQEVGHLATTWAEVRRISMQSPFLQEFHDQGACSFGGVAKQGRILVGGCYDASYDAADLNGPPNAAVPVEDAGVSAFTATLIKNLGYTGFFNTNWVFDRLNRPYLIDFNGRAYGTWPAQQAWGLDLVGAYLFALGLGEDPVLASELPVAGPGSGRQALLRFPFPPSTNKDMLLARRREAVQVIRSRRSMLGGRWAAVSRVKVEMSTMQGARDLLLKRN